MSPSPEAGPPKSKFAAILLLIGKITGLLAAITALFATFTNPEVLKFVQAHSTPHEQEKEISLVDDRQVEKGLIGTWEGYIADNEGKCTYSWQFKDGHCEWKADYFYILGDIHHIMHTDSGWHIANQMIYIDPPFRSLPDNGPTLLVQPQRPQPWVFAVAGTKQVVSLAHDKLVFKMPTNLLSQSPEFTMTRKR